MKPRNSSGRRKTNWSGYANDVWKSSRARRGKARLTKRKRRRRKNSPPGDALASPGALTTRTGRLLLSGTFPFQLASPRVLNRDAGTGSGTLDRSRPGPRVLPTRRRCPRGEKRPKKRPAREHRSRETKKPPRVPRIPPRPLAQLRNGSNSASANPLKTPPPRQTR